MNIGGKQGKTVLTCRQFYHVFGKLKKIYCKPTTNNKGIQI